MNNIKEVPTHMAGVELDPLGQMLAAKNHNDLPEHIREGMVLYLTLGIMPGSFCQAVLENKFVEAVGRADHINIMYLGRIASWVHNVCPSSAWGSEEKVLEFAKSRKQAIKEHNDQCDSDYKGCTEQE